MKKAIYLLKNPYNRCFVLSIVGLILVLIGNLVYGDNPQIRGFLEMTLYSKIGLILLIIGLLDVSIHIIVQVIREIVS